MTLLRYGWAGPWSLLGLALAALAALGGARWRMRQGAVECAGGVLTAALTRWPGLRGIEAITFGHVILGVDHATLRRLRRHEQVHVRQYERWGLLFVPAYLLSSLLQGLRGRDPYRDNHFEREAFAKER